MSVNAWQLALQLPLIRKMHLIHLLLPLHDNNQRAFEPKQFQAVRNELTEKFGGITAFVRSPAVGLWKEDRDNINRDEVIMFEIVSDDLNENWWRDYREKLEADFRQEEVLIWAAEVSRL
jgi:hypothetical protein